MDKYIQADGKIITPQTHLTSKQKEAVGLLSIGTLLEHFDLMLFVHMSVLLNELFFPKVDDRMKALLSATTFCSTFVFRPVAALLFGWIGDNIGRKATVIITTALMAVSCVVMANLPTYAQIGIAASWIMIICRIVQGISTSAELIGAEIYLSEISKPPIQYPIVAMIGCFGVLGISCALGAATLFTSYGLNWRIAFWLGATVAIVGSLARTRLKETPEFVNAKLRIKNKVEKIFKTPDLLKENIILHDKLNINPGIFYFLVQCSWPVYMYFGYIHCGNLLVSRFGYKAEQVIQQNFSVSLVHLATMLILAAMSYRIYPLKILKTLTIIFGIFSLLCPLLLDKINSPFQLFLIQAFVMIFGPKSDFPASPVFFRNLPVFTRFTQASLAFAISRALIYGITSFGLISLIDYFGNMGLLFILLPVIIGYAIGINYFEKLEKQNEQYTRMI
ncbi:MFS transporter [Candidatus Tisiphia endosymbiont of Beris chalybata]|uniref:MFS transporter n=1 Tax=Candidatus Tisiphia endosymbiont of Beris chalybata TaxID=3066262 RepID=UPI00312C94C1